MDKKKRGRPRGSKNKPREIIKLGVDGIPLNPITLPIDKIYTYVSTQCDCVYTSRVYGTAMFCEHKNPLILDTKVKRDK